MKHVLDLISENLSSEIKTSERTLSVRFSVPAARALASSIDPEAGDAGAARDAELLDRVHKFFDSGAFIFLTDCFKCSIKAGVEGSEEARDELMEKFERLLREQRQGEISGFWQVEKDVRTFTGTWKYPQWFAGSGGIWENQDLWNVVKDWYVNDI